MNRLSVVFSTFLFLLPYTVIAGPSCEEAGYYSVERFVSIQTKFIDGYRFDITKPPVYSSNSKVDSVVETGEGCDGDSFILITNEDGAIVYFQRAEFPIRFAELDLYKIDKDLNAADLAIFHFTGGGTCCESLRLFKTKPEFKYIGEIPAVLK